MLRENDLERYTAEMQDKEKDLFVLRRELLNKEEVITMYKNKENSLKASELILAEQKETTDTLNHNSQTNQS